MCSVKMVRICQPEAANGASQTAAKFKSDMVVSNKVSLAQTGCGKASIVDAWDCYRRRYNNGETDF